uniref:Signal peptidase I n=1 Tax=Thermosphaera aggregans TaxID=54254 RepID=A0A7C2FE62_9CREN
MKERLREIIQISYVILIIAFSIGARFLPTPIGFFTVSGFSMYPTLKPGDLVIGVGSFITPYKEGDVVIYCVNVSTCVVHRLVLVNGTYAITKGDYNPSNDPPISTDSIRFKVIGTIPLLVWLPLTVVSLIFIFFPLSPRKGLKQAFLMETFVFLIFLLLNLTYLTIYVLQTPPAFTKLSLPSMSLASLYTENGYSTLIIDYHSTGLKIKEVEDCFLIAQSLTIQCSSYHVDGDRVLVHPPGEFYMFLFENNISAFMVKLTLSLEQGRLVGKYPFTVDWRRPVLEITNNKLVISNPNPIPIEILGYRIRSYGDGLKARYMGNVTEYSAPGFILQPFETEEIDLSWIPSQSYIEVRYVFFNQTFTWVGRIDK